MDPKRLSGILMMTAGALFLAAGLIRRLQEPLWLVLGAAFLALGAVILRQRSG